MKHQHPTHPEPKDAQARRARPVIVCYPTQTLPQVDSGGFSGEAGGRKTGTAALCAAPNGRLH